MPTNITLYKVFLASPGDVKEERLIVKKVIDEINTGNYLTNEIKLELITWETHSWPSTGIDAQDVINKQLPNDYDIFIGIMWNRFGTPTNRAESGTKEEFDRAFEKNKADPKGTQVLFFFKTTAIPVKEIDLDSLVKIRKFQEELIGQGVYFREFDQLHELETLLRFGLASVLKEFKNESHSISIPVVIDNVSEEYLQTKVLEETYDIEEIGFYDAIEIATKESSVLQNIYVRMANHLTLLGEQIGSKTEKIIHIPALDQSSRLREVKRLFDQVANNMFAYCKKTREEIPKLNSQQKILVKQYYIVLKLHNSISDDIEEKKNLLEHVTSLKEISIGVLEKIDLLKKEVVGSPQMTNQYAKAKKETIGILNEVMSEFTANANLLEEMERSFQRDLNL